VGKASTRSPGKGCEGAETIFWLNLKKAAKEAQEERDFEAQKTGRFRKLQS